MSATSPICLKIEEGITEPVRSRITYAFRVFAAIYDYNVVGSDSSAICIRYGKSPSTSLDSGGIFIPARYSPVSWDCRMREIAKHRYAGEELFLVHGIDPATEHPDWLGEIFEWISSSQEADIVARDEVGRIPLSEMIFTKLNISPRKPYAAMLMAWLDNWLKRGNTLEAFSAAPSPVPDVKHMVVCSHDVDFYHARRISTFIRLAKNLAISYRLYRSWSYFASNSLLLVDLLKGRQVGNYLPKLVKAIEKCEFRSTIFVVPHRGHRRDPNYEMKDISRYLLEAERSGFSVGVHGSYGSICDSGTLPAEVRTLNGIMKNKSLGSRQHWLRFDRHKKLFQAVEESQLAFDSSLGFPEMVGFRNGASFAFPPYDFEKEKPYPFLEIPLVLMDGNLEAASRSLHENAQELADEVLCESRKYGWGGVAALWHNPVEPISVPDEINRVFWKCAKQRQRFGEQWMSATEFLAASLGRYHNAGLLKDVRVDA
jgi:hypothetical protein